MILKGSMNWNDCFYSCMELLAFNLFGCVYFYPLLDVQFVSLFPHNKCGRVEIAFTQKSLAKIRVDHLYMDVLMCLLEGGQDLVLKIWKYLTAEWCDWPFRIKCSIDLWQNYIFLHCRICISNWRKLYAALSLLLFDPLICQHLLFSAHCKVNELMVWFSKAIRVNT